MTEEYKNTILRLKDWIRRSPYKTAEFAELIGMTEHTISWVIHERKKRQNFTSEQAAAVERTTGGEIKANELLAHVIPDGYKLVPVEQEGSACEDDGDLVNIQSMIDEAQSRRAEAELPLNTANDSERKGATV